MPYCISCQVNEHDLPYIEQRHHDGTKLRLEVARTIEYLLNACDQSLVDDAKHEASLTPPRPAERADERYGRNSRKWYAFYCDSSSVPKPTHAPKRRNPPPPQLCFLALRMQAAAGGMDHWFIVRICRSAAASTQFCVVRVVESESAGFDRARLLSNTAAAVVFESACPVSAAC